MDDQAEYVRLYGINPGFLNNDVFCQVTIGIYRVEGVRNF